MEIMMLKSCFMRLNQSLLELSLKIENSPSVFVASSSREFVTGPAGILAAQQGITDLFYSKDVEDGRFTNVCLGGVALPNDALDAVIEVNRAKDEFHTACKTVIENAKNKHGRVLLSQAARAKRLREILKEAGYPRLSLRHCFRHIALLHHSPLSIRFSYSSGGRSIRRVSVQDALTLLEKAGYESDEAMAEHKLLSELPVDTPLAQVQSLAGYFKANVFHDAESSPETISAFLPIFYPYDADRPVKRQMGLPEPDPDKRVKRKVRTDKKLKDEPFVSSIRVFAYN